MKNDLRYVTYVCSGCRAEDTNKYYPEEQNWVVTTCWKCGAGKGKDVGGMLKTGVGMFPKDPRGPHYTIDGRSGEVISQTL